MDFLQQYTFTVQQIVGKANVVVDALSRRAKEGEESEIKVQGIVEENKLSVIGCNVLMISQHGNEQFEQKIKEGYRTNEDMRETIRKINNGEEVRNVTYANGYLVYNAGRTNQIIVPPGARMDIMRTFHDEPMAVHHGINKMVKLISRKLLWPNLTKEVGDYVRSCTDT
eukprot:GHVS01000843.1.p1 GENE.GHVS01000843.1~~GHVS01000843.1.p1  ORF type:complete len:169 (-),score=18.46 GHVS01000843.1:88-594(-)